MIKTSRRDPYEELANAIILKAVKDYRSSSRRRAKGRKSSSAQYMQEECLRFFRGEWFTVLTDIN